MSCPPVVGWLQSEVAARRIPGAAWLETSASKRLTWAIEFRLSGETVLAQQLIAASETMLDVPPTLSAWVWLLDTASQPDELPPPCPALWCCWSEVLPTVMLEQTEKVVAKIAAFVSDTTVDA
jgi:hypothetical protein